MRKVIAWSFFVVAALALGTVRAGSHDPYPPSFEQRVAAQRAIETVYWNHRIWPAENLGAKPDLHDVIPDATLRAKVEDSLKKSAALNAIWHRPLTPANLQAEMDRMARSSRRPEMLEELFGALGHDPTLIAETLVREKLADRFIREAYANDPPAGTEQTFDRWWEQTRSMIPLADAPRGDYALPTSTIGCTDDSWDRTPARPASVRRGHTAVWTGSEMIVWGGFDSAATGYLGDGGRYDPSTDSWTDMPLPSGMLPRAFHAAVWTGTEMIVTGGYNGTYLFTTSRFNPSTNLWTLTTNSGTAARASHTAIWTGTVMIIWGGSNGSIFTNLNSGSRYDPSGDTWTSTSTTGAPTGRAAHSAVWTGSEMIVWGGSQVGFMTPTTYLNTGGRYDPVTNSWAATSTGTNVPSIREGHEAVWTGSELIVWGGFSGGTTYPNTGGRYNPSTDSWASTSTGANVPVGRTNSVSAWTGSEMIVWGGNSSTGPTTYYDTGGRYDPASNSWSATDTGAGQPVARTQHTGIWTGSELVVWGGVNAANMHLNSGGRLTPSTGWTATALGVNVPTGYRNHAYVWTGSEMIVWGGLAASETNTGGRYDPATNSWMATSTGANVPSARSTATGIWSGTEMIVWGGVAVVTDFNDGGRYNPVSDSWTATSVGANVPAPRRFHTAVWTGKEMIVWGGNSAGVINTGGRYNPVSDSWQATSDGANVPSARSSHPALWTGKEMIIWGGSTSGGGTNTGGRYDPVSDSWQVTSTGANVPGPRTQHSLVWTGSKMVVWGGNSGGYLNDGGRYDPVADTWMAMSGGGAPSARGLHAAVWTRERMVVWGGFNGGPAFNSGGRYDPLADTWTATSIVDPDLPIGRWLHSGVWADGEMIVWGGVTTGSGGLYCACATGAPSAVPDLRVTKPTLGSTTARLTWLALVNATGYDVMRGGLGSLHSSDGDFSTSADMCLTQNQAGTTLDDAQALATGAGVWYLLRGASCGGVGSYDSGGAQQIGLRDAEVSGSGVGCP